DDETHERLAFELVGDADRRRLGDGRAADQHRLHLSRSEPFAGDLDRVVGAPEHVPKVVFGIHIGPVAMDPNVFEAAPIRIEVALAVAPEAARHPRPRIPDRELADLAAHGSTIAVEHVRGHTGDGARERAGAQVGDYVAAQDFARDIGDAGVVDHGYATASG